MHALSGYRALSHFEQSCPTDAGARRIGTDRQLEEGKPIKEATTEAARAAETMELSAEEAKRLGGEVLPLDGARAGRENSASHCACRAAWWWRSRRSIFR